MHYLTWHIANTQCVKGKKYEYIFFFSWREETKKGYVLSHFKSNQILCVDLVRGYKFSLGLTRIPGQNWWARCIQYLLLYLFFFFFYEYEWMTQYFTWWNYVINPDSLLGWHGVRSDLFEKKKIIIKNHSNAFTVVCGAVSVCCEKVLLLNKYKKIDFCGASFFLSHTSIRRVTTLFHVIRLAWSCCNSYSEFNPSFKHLTI